MPPPAGKKCGHLGAVAKVLQRADLHVELLARLDRLHDRPAFPTRRSSDLAAAADDVLIVTADNREGAAAAHSGHGLAVEFLVERQVLDHEGRLQDRKSTRLNCSHTVISYAASCWKKMWPPGCRCQSSAACGSSC